MSGDSANADDIQRLQNRISILEKDLAISHRNRSRLEDIREKNQRLLETVNAELQETLSELKRAQDSLIQSEKLAALGQLTAGIAHEIKNPLNFVSNFAEVSVELLEELGGEIEPALAVLDDEARKDALDLMQTLSGNLGKISEHGARADRIVKGMLAHAREGSDSAATVNFNDLAEECLNLAYHGMRAAHQEFNATLERDFDDSTGEVDLFPQEFSRVLLNLIGNGFYAVHQRQLRSLAGDYKPLLSVSTRARGEEVEVSVRDNGVGIPAAALDKIFHPFFTTKPAGEGTGLGLSLSYETVVQQHQGRIDVETAEGGFTEFIVVIPRKRARPEAT